MTVADGRLFVGTASNFLLFDPPSYDWDLSGLQTYFAKFMEEHPGIDWSAWQQFFGWGSDCNWIGTEVWASQPVPEPMTILLLGSGLAGLLGFRKRLRR
jgi:hypothetical protein